MSRPAQPIKVYNVPVSGHGHRVELALSLLGLPYERIEIDFRAGEHKSPAFLAKNPFGQIPVIEDGDVTVADSNAILVYLARRYDPSGRWLPQAPVAAAAVQRWFSVAAGELHAGPAAARGHALFLRQPVPAEITKACARLFQLIDAQLTSRDFLAGDDPTLADVAMYSYTALAPEGRLSLDPYPRLRAWLARIEALPGFVPLTRSPLPQDETAGA